MTETAGILCETEFFSEFPAEALQRLEKNSAVRKYKKNSHLIVLGDECHAAYVLLQGSAHAYTEDESGNEFIVNSFNAGDCFGELGLLDGEPRTANIITTSPCECLVIPKVELTHIIDTVPGVAQVIMRSLVRRIRNMTEDVSCLALMDVYGRLVRVLTTEAVEDATDGRLKTGRLTHQDLGKKVGSSREMISKILKDLKAGGYIATENHCIVLEKQLPDRW